MATKIKSKRAAPKKQAAKTADSKAVTKAKATQEAPATTTKGRVHTIAKPRANPLTRRPHEPTGAADDAATIEADQTVEATTTTPQTSNDGSEIVVFAFRLTRAERDAIHEAAGSAKASKFVRGIALAAARGDAKEVKQVMETLQKTG